MINNYIQRNYNIYKCAYNSQNKEESKNKEEPHSEIYGRICISVFVRAFMYMCMCARAGMRAFVRVNVIKRGRQRRECVFQVIINAFPVL